MKVIVGLGNPGKEYDGTRHNVGFFAVDALAKDAESNWKKDTKRHAQVAKADIDGIPVILAKPETFMNKSGDAVQSLLSFYKMEMEDVLVVHDDMDIQGGRIQFKTGGGAAGHHGIEHIIETLGSDAFQRLRIGVGKPEDNRPSEDWVLGHLSTRDTPNALDITSAMRDWIRDGVEKSSNRWN